jgi:hypothetical protein
MEPWTVLRDRALHPGRAFQERAARKVPLGAAVEEMLILRTPVAFLSLILTYTGFASLYARVADPGSDFWRTILAQLPDAMDPGDLARILASLPPLPSLPRMLVPLAFLAPLGILSLWLHDATFDHAALWLLGGLKGRRSFRTTLAADADALKVAVFGAALALIGDLPGTGILVAFLLAPVAVYFWIIRGYALAAWHGCPPWKGIAATVLNVVLATALVVGMLAVCVVIVILAL